MEPFPDHYSDHYSDHFGPDQGFIVAPPEAGPWQAGPADASLTSHDFPSAIDASIAPGGQGDGLRLPVYNDRTRTELEIPQCIPEPPTATRLIRPKTDQDWEDHRARIAELYWEQDKDLGDVIDQMKEEHRERQYKLRFKRWKIEKNIKTVEAQAMVRIRKRRKEHEGKSTDFELRKRKVPPQKVDRFEKRQKLRDGGALPVSGESSSLEYLCKDFSDHLRSQPRPPPDLTYHTPPPLEVLRSPSVDLSPRRMDVSIPLDSFSLLPAVRIPPRDPVSATASFDIHLLGLSPKSGWAPTMDFLAGVISSPSHLTKTSVPSFEHVEDIGHVDQSLTLRSVRRQPFDTPANTHLQLLDQSPPLQEYVNIELSDRLHGSHLSDPPKAISSHGSGRGSVFLVTPGKGEGSGKPGHAVSCPTTQFGALDCVSLPNLIPEITIQQPSGTATQPFTPTLQLRSIAAEPSTADLEIVDSVVTRKAVHNELGAPTGATRGRITRRPGTLPMLIDDGRSHDVMGVGRFITIASPAPSRTNSDVYATPMGFPVDSPTAASESEFDEYATPMGITMDSSTNTPRPDSENHGTPMYQTIVNTIGSLEQGAHPDENTTPKNSTADYVSPAPESEYATPMEIAVTGSIVVSERLFDDEIRPIDLAVYERSVKLTATSRIPDEPIDVIEKRLRFAAKVGNLKAVKELLRRGATIDARSKVGMSALHLATYNDHSDVLKFLLDMGAKLDTVGSEMEFHLTGRNVSISNPHPIHLAALRGHRVCTNILLERTDILAVSDLENLYDTDDSTGLMEIAVENDHVELAQFVIRSRGKDWFQEYEDEYRTPLATAARNGSLPLVSLFLDHGMSPNIVFDADITLLWIASAWCHQSLVNYLLQNDADVDWSDVNGVSPLDVAIAQGHRNVARSLLQKGASTGGEGEMGMQSSLQVAVGKGDVDMVQLLLTHGANPNVSPVRMAAERGHLDILKILRDHGVDVPWTPLGLATLSGCTVTVKTLLDEGSDPNVRLRGKDWEAPLHIAVDHGLLEIADLLLKGGADPQGLDLSRRTPLEIAISNNSYEIVQLLLRNGADPNGADPNGADPNVNGVIQRTPLHIAESLGSRQVAELLVKGGADANRLDSSGRSPFHAATASGYPGMVSLLLAGGADVNLPTGDGLPALYIALTTAHDSMITCGRVILGYLLDNDADPALILPHPTATHTAMAAMKMNSLVRSPGWSYHRLENWHLMHLAAGVGNEAALESLLRLARDGQPLLRIKSPTKRKETALHVAVRAGHLGAVRLLANADRSATYILDSNMDTPLQVAVKSTHLDIAQELFRLGDAAHQLTYKRKEFTIPHYASSMVLSSSLVQNLLELLFCSGLYMRDHGPRQGHAGITTHVKNRSAAIWILCRKFDEGALEDEWLRLVALSLRNHDEILFKFLVEIMPDVEAGRRGLEDQLLSYFKPIYDVFGESGQKSVRWDGVKAFMEENVNLFSPK
ncbi:ankyrin repeat protein [Colletotrichum musicola]|uniref:Ankyrin repeat protein n=1 Tax=Colletotrichum musicola TaxID=2175873 RepID=A0A8H6MJV2_9PEZI|nr:ankyrin repeat protein [Colletotrichum musicola]